MPALNFKKQFADDVELGIKSQTIRAKRKYPIKIGDVLYLYTGMRTKSCRKLGQTTCKMAREILITETGVKVDGDTLSANSVRLLAEKDGFTGVDEFRQFFRDTHSLPFIGQIIEWNNV